MLNGAPPKRDNAESPIAAAARESLEKLKAPVWSGQISDRTTYYRFRLPMARGRASSIRTSQAATEIARLSRRSSAP